MAWTAYPELNDILSGFVDGLRHCLPGNLIGIYLQGSFAVGDSDEHSDVDFIVVLERDLSSEESRRLQELHRRLYERPTEWAKHLEGSYFPKSLIADTEYAEHPLWYLDHGANTLVRSTHCNTVVVRQVLREHGIPLLGPQPADLINAIPSMELRREIFTTIHNWGRDILENQTRYANRFYQGFIVLSYCRMLHDLYSGAVGSKRAGADWAMAELNPVWRPLIHRAWSCRPNPAVSVRQPADPGDFQQTLEFVRYCMDYSRGISTLDTGAA